MNSNLFLILQFIAFTTAATKDTYKGAVVEYSPIISNVLANAAKFAENIQAAAIQGADIIVFPEIGLNGYGLCSDDMLTEVPHPSEKTVPCNNPAGNFSNAFQEISCAAKMNQIYVVVNIAEVSPCSNEECPAKGRLRYNTNVVFDRSGAVIARYRKFHLFGEVGTDRTADPQLVFFDTDFGVRFGTFICFDMMFAEPAVQLIKQLEIRDVVFSTAWFSELPFLTALQAQGMWSYAMDVNFLASGYNAPEVGSGGSGIYQGRGGPLTMIFPETSSSTLLIAELPINPSARIMRKPQAPALVGDIENSTLYLKSENLAIFSTNILTDGNSSLCQNDFCCNFEIEFNVDEEKTISYRAAVLDGVRTFSGVATGGVQICAVISCLNDTLSGCGLRTYSDLTFNKIRISGSFDAKTSLQMPSTLRQASNLEPLIASEFSFSSNCGIEKCNVTMETNENISNLLTFAIYNRVYSRDGEPATTSGGLAIIIFQLYWLFPIFLSKLL